MSNEPQIQFVIVGRLVGGDLYSAKDTDYEGNKRFYKADHPTRAGQPHLSYDFSVAVPKLGESHWSQRADWGQMLYAFGVQAWPQGQTQRQDFSWKITDGDDTVPNKKGNKPCDREGYPGHWVLHLSVPERAPDLYKLQDGRPVVSTVKNEIKIGYWVQAEVRVRSNSNANNAGLYLKHGVVCLVGIDKEIAQRSDPVKLGIGQNIKLPPGVSMTNFAAVATPSLPTQMPAAFTAPASFIPQSGAPQLTPPPQIPVTPRPSFLTPGAPTAAGVPLPPTAPLPPPPANVGPVLTAKAGGATYAQLVAAGWTDALMRQEGLLV